MSFFFFFFPPPFNASLAQSCPARKHVVPALLSTGPVVLTALLCNHTWIIYQTGPTLMNSCSSIPTTYQLCLQNPTIDITAFPHGSLCMSLLSIMPADWHRIPQRSEHQISLLNPPLHTSHICLLTRRALDVTEVLGHMCSAETWPPPGMAFIFRPGCLPV